MRFFIFGLLHLCAWSQLRAQECTPSPGPAIFMEDFGSGANPGLPLASGTTTYSYGSINSGSYVVSNTTGLDLGFWHDDLDNTEGDTNGYMLIFNASEGASTYYQKTFTALCPNTDYIFASHVANLAVPTACIGVAVLPNVQFTVIDPDDGSTLASNTTGDIFYDSFLTWREYTIRFRTGPDQTTLLIQLTNNAAAGCGNDLAIDDISLRLCNIQEEQSFDLCDLPGGSLSIGENNYTEPGVYMDALPAPNSCNDTLVTTTLTGTTRLLPTLNYTFCQGDTLAIDDHLFTASISFVDTLDGPTPDCPLFQPYEIIAQSEQYFTQNVTLCSGDSLQVGDRWYTDAGTYLDTLSTSSSCDSVVMTTIITGAIAIDIMPTSVDVEVGQSVELMGTVSFSTMYSLSWSPQDAFSCLDCLTPVLQPPNSGTYQVFAIDIPSGCIDSLSIPVMIKTCDNVYIPNAFSPNFDEVNDRFEIFTEECFTQLVSWRIFDRWGGLVFETEKQPLSGSFTGWDGQINGQAATQGIYGYQLLLERADGTQKEMMGEVVLLR